MSSACYTWAAVLIGYGGQAVLGARCCARGDGDALLLEAANAAGDGNKQKRSPRVGCK